MKIHQKVKAVVFDLAGTITDFGSNAPMNAFVQLFEKFKIKLTIQQARQPMGSAKLDHIRALLALKEIRQQWQEIYGVEPTEKDVEHLHDVFTPMNAEIIADYSDLIPGTLDVIQQLRQKDIKIGSTTGYNRAIIEALLPVLAKKGYMPDSLVCAGDLVAGRPSPLMMYQTFAKLGVWPPHTVIKVDDTVVGLQEGFNAGTWVVAVAVSGNEVGLDLPKWQSLSIQQQQTLKEKAYQKFASEGAHYVIDTVADLLPVVEEIEKRIQTGEKPN